MASPKHKDMQSGMQFRDFKAKSRWKGSLAIAMSVLLVAFLTHSYWPLLKSSSPSRRGIGEESNSQILQLAKQASPIAHHSVWCSGNGEIQLGTSNPRVCSCHQCFIGTYCSERDKNCIIDINQGDPKIFEAYWIAKGEDGGMQLSGSQGMSYYADSKEFFFVQTTLDSAIRSVHEAIGNAFTEGSHIVIGTGSTQLFQAALYALSTPPSPSPKRVISLAPYYSAYPTLTTYLKSSLYSWDGDAAQFNHDTESNSYIELVTTPNNPSGEVRYPVVNGSGKVIHDLAYFWPHFTPISSPANEELMLFTLSKSTGHAGSRIGWAIVKDFTVAKNMAKFIELNTIGVSKDAQLRAAQVLRSVAKEYEKDNGHRVPLKDLDSREKSSFRKSESVETNTLFHFGYHGMEERWLILRSALKESVHFALPSFQPDFCTFFGKVKSPTPAFAWLECLQEDDCERFLKQHNILARGGVSFGTDPRYVRLSMLDRSSGFEALIDRLVSVENTYVEKIAS